MPYPYQETQAEPSTPSSKWHVPLVVILLLSALLIGYFLYQPVQNIPEKQSVVPQTKELSLKLAFASIIDDSYNYQSQPNSEYSQGSPVYIYAEIKDFTQDNLNIDVSEDVDIKDALGKTVFAQTEFSSLKQTFTQVLPLIKFRNIFPTIKWIPGKYTATIRINDNLGKKSVTKSSDFTITPQNKEGVNEVANLAGLAGNSSSIKLREFISTKGPDGKIIPELTYNITYTNAVSNDELSKISASLQIPPRYDAGAYTVEFKFENVATGKSQTLTKQIVVTKNLDINQFVFASSVDSNYNYKIQPNSVYKSGSTVNVYLRLIDFAQPLVNGKYNIKFTEDISVLDSTGKIIMIQPDYIKVDSLNLAKLDSYNIKNAFSTSSTPGKYTFRVLIKDGNSNQQVTKDGVFTLE